MSEAEASKPVKPKHKLSRRTLIGAAVRYGSAAVVGGAAVKGADWLADGAGVKPKGFSRARPILTDTKLPASVDVAIIGGGFIGTATALELARRGVSVALFEKGVIAGESSGRSGGLIEAMLTDPTKMDLIELSKQRWAELSSMTGEYTGFLKRGSTMLFGKNKADMLGLCEGWVESVKGLPNGGARMVSAAEAARMAPGSTSPLAGGLTCPDDASAEPVYSAPAMAIGARKLGAKIYQFCAVRGLERTGGRVSGVVTEKGTVKCSSVVLAGGVWSQVLAHDLGLDLRTLQCFAKGASLHPFEGPDFGTLSIVADHEVGWRKQSDGGYIVWEFTGIAPLLPVVVQHPFQLMPAFEANAAALRPRFSPSTFWRWVPSSGKVPLDRPGIFEQTRIYEPELAAKVIDEGITHLQQTMPIFERGSVRERWSGAMQMAIDNMPIISGVDSVPGLYVGTGFYYGLTMGPGAGILLADLVTGAKPSVDPKNYRLSRFSDGSDFAYRM